MKKFLFVFAMFLAMATTAIAGSDLKIKSGSMSAIQQEDAKVLVQVDLSNCRWEKDEDFKTWCGNDYNQRANTAAPSLASGFNDKTKGNLKLVTSGDAKYKAVFTVTNMARKQGMGMWGSCYIKEYGTIEITEIATGKSICTIVVNGQKGDTDFVENDRIAKAFVGVGEAMAKLK